jgi:hypothetical protein
MKKYQWHLQQVGGLMVTKIKDDKKYSIQWKGYIHLSNINIKAHEKLRAPDKTTSKNIYRIGCAFSGLDATIFILQLGSIG